MFIKDLFLTTIAKMDGLDMLQYMGTKVYLISFLVLFLVPLITAIILANTLKGKKLIAILVVIFAEMLIILALIALGFLPWMTNIQ